MTNLSDSETANKKEITGAPDAIEYLIMDPEGNITILVCTDVDRSEYQKVTRALLAACPEAEQVGFMKPQEHGKLPYMEMSGLEFCGNATRAFAFYEATRQQPPLDEIDVLVSGCDYPLHAWIDSASEQGGNVRLQMPIPTEMEHIRISLFSDMAEMTGLPQIEGELVHMDGISHLIIREIPAERLDAIDHDHMEQLFIHIRDQVYEMTGRDMPAFGLMFADVPAGRMIPIVYVRDVDTIYFEGSCASGTNAASYALAMQDLKEEGTISYTLKQPAGTLNVDIAGRSAAQESTDSIEICSMQLYGHVGISDLQRLDNDF